MPTSKRVAWRALPLARAVGCDRTGKMTRGIHAGSLSHLRDFVRFLVGHWPITVVSTDPAIVAILDIELPGLRLLASPPARTCHCAVPIQRSGQHLGWVLADTNGPKIPNSERAAGIPPDSAPPLVGALQALAACLSTGGVFATCRTLAALPPPPASSTAARHAGAPIGARAVTGRHHQLAEMARREIDLALAVAGTARNLTIDCVAGQLGLSAGHLSRIFHRCVGRTFRDYLSEQRVALAKTMLANPRINIAEVAYLCGFGDATYFARVFRKVTHQSPSEFRAAPST